MKIKNILIALSLCLVVLSSCTLEDNINMKRATEVPVETVFTRAQIRLVQQYNSMSVNGNISRLLCQHWGQITYTQEGRYDFADRTIPNSFWLYFYRDVLMDLKECQNILGATDGGSVAEIKNQEAVVEILSVFTYATLVETFGDVPYTEALLAAEGNSTPKYDDAETIYRDLFTRLNSALASIDESAASFGNADILLSGDMVNWAKFGNSLKVRLAMRMADVDADFAKEQFAAAYTKAFSADERADFEWIGADPYVNTIFSGYVIDGRRDFVPSNTIIDYMKEYNDPRISLLFKQKDGDYVGVEYGQVETLKYADYSNFTDMFLEASLPATVIDGVEVEFLIAEAIERGFISGSAEKHYNNAISASIKYWGGTDADAAAYLKIPKVAYTSAGTWKESIGIQKWFALYNQGCEAWTEWRRLDQPILNVPEELEYSDIPSRYPYPYNEDDMNGTNYAAAAKAIGGDKATTKLFWDKN